MKNDNFACFITIIILVMGLFVLILSDYKGKTFNNDWHKECSAIDARTNECIEYTLTKVK